MYVACNGAWGGVGGVSMVCQQLKTFLHPITAPDPTKKHSSTCRILVSGYRHLRQAVMQFVFLRSLSADFLDHVILCSSMFALKECTLSFFSLLVCLMLFT